MRKILAFAVLLTALITGCQKEISYEGGIPGAITGDWKFKVDTLSFAGPTDSFTVYPGTGVEIFGQNPAGTQLFDIIINGTVAAGQTYRASTLGVQFTYSTSAGAPLYESVIADPTRDFTVTVTSITDSTIVGTFAGTVQADTAYKQVTAGSFAARRKVASSGGGTSAGTLGTALDTCTGAVLAGTYKKNAALTAANTVSVQVNVTTAGTYTIYTDTLKGIFFRTSGTFTTTGTQTVILSGNGTPTDSAAAAKFRVKYNTSNCGFTVKIDTSSAVVVVPTGDLFPLTANSWWSYNSTDIDPDTARSLNSFTMPFGGNTYRGFQEFEATTLVDSSYYRKSGNDYFAYYSDLSQTFLTVAQPGEINFLKDNATVGQTWNSVEYSGTSAIVPLPAKLQYVFTCTAANVSETVNGKTYNGVTKVTTRVRMNPAGTGYQDVAVLQQSYARGIGLIHASLTVNGLPGDERTIRNYQVF